MIRWDTCREVLRLDGSLRDIYVASVTLADWLALYPVLCDYPGTEYLVDGIVQPLPETVEQTFATWSSGNPMLRLRVGRTLVVFHFFSEEEIECDFDPQEVASQADLDAVLGFVRQIGDVTGKRVAVTPENLREQPFITYDPESREFKCHHVAV